MTITVELTRFRVPADRAEALLEARSAMVAEFREHRNGFLDAQLVRIDAETWLDIVNWLTPEDFSASRAQGADHPGIKAFFSHITEVLAMEEGVSVEDHQ